MESRHLTERQCECLRWASHGKTMAEIAVVLDISVHTVGHHLAEAQLRLAASNRGHAIAIALRHGLIE